mmetsp:Transcript_45162/g.105306  ORF Transcript_45162/g.105306 Transcript_45162/m.105306 type:complete len:286 (-) Transcript_45162:20-877(-)
MGGATRFAHRHENLVTLFFIIFCKLFVALFILSLLFILLILLAASAADVRATKAGAQGTHIHIQGVGNAAKDAASGVAGGISLRGRNCFSFSHELRCQDGFIIAAVRKVWQRLLLLDAASPAPSGIAGLVSGSLQTVLIICMRFGWWLVADDLLIPLHSFRWPPRFGMHGMREDHLLFAILVITACGPIERSLNRAKMEVCLVFIRSVGSRPRLIPIPFSWRLSFCVNLRQCPGSATVLLGRTPGLRSMSNILFIVVVHLVSRISPRGWAKARDPAASGAYVRRL